MLQHTYAFDYNKEKLSKYREERIDANKVFEWSKDNLYRTSYGNHWTKKPQMPKNMDIPGYGGFVPGVISKNEYGKGYSKISREMYNDESLGKNKTGLSCSGWNATNYKHVDYSLQNNNNRYGQQTLQHFNPCLQETNPKTNTKNTYLNPASQLNPTFRPTPVHLQLPAPIIPISGFNSNYQKCDGKGWVPHPILNGPRDRSEYRDIYNSKQQFHRTTNQSVDRTLKINCNTYFK